MEKSKELKSMNGKTMEEKAGKGKGIPAVRWRGRRWWWLFQFSGTTSSPPPAATLREERKKAFIW